MINALKLHLSKRQISPILENLNEKNEQNSETALKFLCVLDYNIEKNLLYNEMKIHPKFLKQLLSFTSYENFKFYQYKSGKDITEIIGNRILKCQFCDLIGPYTFILTHTAISHNVHIGLKKCAYCNREEIQNASHSIEMCYKNYLDKRNIDDKNVPVKFFDGFFEMLNQLAKVLDVCIKRIDNFNGIGKPKKEYICGFSDMCKVYTVPRSTSKKINTRHLEKLFKQMVENMYGSNGLSRLLSHDSDDTNDDNNDMATIEPEDSDNSRNVTNESNSNTVSVQNRFFVERTFLSFDLKKKI